MSAYWRTLALGHRVRMTFAGYLVVVVVRDRYSLERTKALLDLHCQPIIDDLRQVDPTARLNIMLAGWRHFDFVKCYYMDNDPDANLILRVDSGVAGLAIKHETWAVAAMAPEFALIVGGQACAKSRGAQFLLRLQRGIGTFDSFSATQFAD